MTKDELVQRLKEMREAGKAERRTSAMTHLFGIIFKRQIASVSNPAEIAREAGVPDYIGDGCNLAEFVTVRRGVREKWQPPER